MQTDPIGYEDDLNLYIYVRNDPLNNSDPTGRQTRYENDLMQRDMPPMSPEAVETAETAVGVAVVAATLISPVPGDEAVAIGAVGSGTARSPRGRELMETASEIAINTALDTMGPQEAAPRPSGDGLTVGDVDAMARPPEVSGTLDTRVEEAQRAGAAESVRERSEEARPQSRSRGGRATDAVRVILEVIEAMTGGGGPRR